MRILAPLLLLVLLLAPGSPCQAPKVDEKKIAELEKRVTVLEGKLATQVAALRETYRHLERDLGDARRTDDGARLVAEMVRVLEPALKEARALGEKQTPANKAKVLAHLKKAVPEALARLEIRPLVILNDWLEKRLLSLLQERGNIFEALTLSNEELARLTLREVLDEQTPFPIRWNTLLADSLKEVGPYRKACTDLEAARVDVSVARDPLLAWQIGAPPGFARVPAGSYVLLSTRGFGAQGARKKERPFQLARDLYVGIKEVTNAEYYAWFKTLSEEERKKHVPRDAADKILWPVEEATNQPAPAAEAQQLPVVGISFTSALAYALSQGCRLPTEEEWAAAVSGLDKRLYPWGGAWEQGRANDRDAGVGTVQPVGSYPTGRGPFGHYDLAGNAAEWTLTYESGKTVDPAAKIEDTNVIVRGGSYQNSKEDISAGWVWHKRATHDHDAETGFRLARDKDAPPAGK